MEPDYSLEAAVAEVERLRKIIRAAHMALTKASLTPAERVQDATSALSRGLVPQR